MTYDFNKIADELYQYIKKDKQVQSLRLPTIETEILPTRLHWKNVKEFLKLIQRDPDHFMDFLKKEIPDKNSNWYSGSKSDGLIIHGKYLKPILVKDLAIKYVNNFVVCPSCKQVSTQMNKFGAKKYEFECNECGMHKFF